MDRKLDASPAPSDAPAHVTQGVREVIVAQLGIDPEEVRPETYLIDLDAGPLDLIEIVLGLEAAFGVRLSTASSARREAR